MEVEKSVNSEPQSEWKHLLAQTRDSEMNMSGENNKRQVKLIPSDTQTPISIPYNVACFSMMIKSMLEDSDEYEEDIIPLHAVDEKTIRKIILFMEKHVNDPFPIVEKPIQTNDIKKLLPNNPWDIDYLDMKNEELFKVILAANYLDITPLMDACSIKIACHIKDRDPQYIKTYFGAEEPSMEEEIKAREDNKLLFEIADKKPTPTVPMDVENEISDDDGDDDDDDDDNDDVVNDDDDDDDDDDVVNDDDDDDDDDL